jgi:hypothetical protein
MLSIKLKLACVYVGQRIHKSALPMHQVPKKGTCVLSTGRNLLAVSMLQILVPLSIVNVIIPFRCQRTLSFLHVIIKSPDIS